eukprot:GHVO01010140.1.p1 GENE.GHVO01010140.1~~GHVO01010140.1.p1  ORF type:complete len:420 (-),score=54.99 GHVO01010140.1:247-1485(-)
MTPPTHPPKEEISLPVPAGSFVAGMAIEACTGRTLAGKACAAEGGEGPPGIDTAFDVWAYAGGGRPVQRTTKKRQTGSHKRRSSRTIPNMVTAAFTLAVCFIVFLAAKNTWINVMSQEPTVPNYVVDDDMSQGSTGTETTGAQTTSLLSRSESHQDTPSRDRTLNDTPSEVPPSPSHETPSHDTPTPHSTATLGTCGGQLEYDLMQTDPPLDCDLKLLPALTKILRSEDTRGALADWLYTYDATAGRHDNLPRGLDYGCAHSEAKCKEELGRFIEYLNLPPMIKLCECFRLMSVAVMETRMGDEDVANTMKNIAPLLNSLIDAKLEFKEDGLMAIYTRLKLINEQYTADKSLDAELWDWVVAAYQQFKYTYESEDHFLAYYSLNISLVIHAAEFKANNGLISFPERAPPLGL